MIAPSSGSRALRAVTTTVIAFALLTAAGAPRAFASRVEAGSVGPQAGARSKAKPTTKKKPARKKVPYIVFVNQAFEQHTGYSRHEVLGQTPHKLLGSGAIP